METKNEAGRWAISGRSENSEMMREELMFGSTPSFASSGLLALD
jgi:hypothetical protein